MPETCETTMTTNKSASKIVVETPQQQELPVIKYKPE